MKKDFKLLKEGTVIITNNGEKTEIECPYVVKTMGNYMNDIWDYLTKLAPELAKTEDYPWDCDPRFVKLEYDEFGDDYVVLDVSMMKADEVDWDYDYVYVKTDGTSLHQGWMSDRLQCLSDISLPRKISELSHDELVDLRGEIVCGSCWIADYNNSHFVENNVVCNASDFYLELLEEEDEEDTPENFADCIEGYIEY